MANGNSHIDKRKNYRYPAAFSRLALESDTDYADSRKYNRYSSRFTIAIVLIYMMMTVGYHLIFEPNEIFWVIRLVLVALLFFAALVMFRLNAKRKLSRTHTAWILPTLMMFIQVGFTIIVPRDSTFFWFLLGSSLMCLSYLDKKALLAYLTISTGTVAIVIYGAGVPVLGKGYDTVIHTSQFLAFSFANILLYIVCLFSIGEIKQYKATGRMYNTFLQMTPSYMVVINSRARVTYISESMAEWFGVHAKYALDIPLLDLCTSFELKMLFQDIIASGTNIEKNFELVIDGRNSWLMIRSARLSDDSIARMFEITDITPIMEAKNEAEAATKAKSDFLAHMSHEIRTPMNAIIGMMELIMLKPLDSDQLSHALSVKGASMSLLNIINDILDLSKIDSQKMDIISEPFDFSSLINDTINMVNIKASSAGIALITDISKDIPPMINGDVLRIKQVLVNLFNNAVKFTKEGYISLSAASEIMDDGRLKLNFSVKDTGIGIKKEDMKKMFGEFQQFDTRKNRHTMGTGLGLSITRRFIELMGGRISVESVYGKGSTFSFYVICEGNHEGTLVSLPDPSRYRVLLYEPSRYHARAARAQFDNLAVYCRIVNTEADFKKTLTDGAYGNFTHVFFDKSAEWIIETSAVSRDIRFILVKEVNDIGSAAYPVSFINRPMLIINVARILSGDSLLDIGAQNYDNIKLGAFKTKDVKILLVDDQPANLIVAEGMLRQYGILVSTAAGGRESIDKAGTDDFDIIFMDHMMPEIDGIEAAKVIRGMGGHLASVPIIALSANAVSGAKEKFLDAGMNDFLSKPIIVNDLHRMLLKYIPKEKMIH
ncbi:MAG: ATP-binding protein [Defluviitaleaceae bacterium]|nr:ATP-binding protein [Defluviitaleaceae bacterium]MCL2837393.1 ATP-binding protein [Defluviitaleaceae bacterium]